MGTPIKDLTGKRFGRLTVLGISGRSQRGHVLWYCRCNCGGEKVAYGSNLKSSQTRSCGCLHREVSRVTRLRHGGSNNILYRRWTTMKQSCENPKSVGYHGGGIHVCERWRDFALFYEDMWSTFKRELFLMRKDKEGDFCPENCYWGTLEEKVTRQKNNRWLEYDGERLTITGWAKKLGVSKQLIHDRLRRGWSTEEALKFAPQKRQSIRNTG